jgi:hypothetical protein
LSGCGNTPPQPARVFYHSGPVQVHVSITQQREHSPPVQLASLAACAAFAPSEREVVSNDSTFRSPASINFARIVPSNRESSMDLYDQQRKV